MYEIRRFSLLESSMSSVRKTATSETCVLLLVAPIYHKLPLKTLLLIRSPFIGSSLYPSTKLILLSIASPLPPVVKIEIKSNNYEVLKLSVKAKHEQRIVNQHCGVINKIPPSSLPGYKSYPKLLTKLYQPKAYKLQLAKVGEALQMSRKRSED